MRIGIFVLGGTGWFGGFNYSLNLLRALALLANERREVVPEAICGRPIGRYPMDELGSWTGAKHWIYPEEISRNGSFFNRALFRCDRGRLRRNLEGLLRNRGFDFVFPLTYANEGNLGLRFPLSKAIYPARWAGWIPDLQHETLPSLFSSSEIGARRKGIGCLMNEAPLVVVSSESVKRQLLELFPDAKDRVQVLRFTVYPDDIWFSEASNSVCLPEEPFFLVANQAWKHKNYEAVIVAASILKSRVGGSFRVICTGAMYDPRDSAYAQSIAKLLRDQDVRDVIQFLGAVSRRHQIHLMQNCRAVIQPSLLEGWSTVVEEGRLLNKLMLLSDIPVHREQGYERCRHFIPTQPEELADLMRSVLEAQSTAGNLFALQQQAIVRSQKFAAQILSLLDPGNREIGVLVSQ